jgi:hypothetical protein
MINMIWQAILIIIIGVGIVADGIGSVLIKGGQYHNIWFDGERYVRTVAGIALIILGFIL